MNQQANILMLMGFAAVVLLILAARNGFVRWRANFTDRARITLDDLFVFVDPQALFALNLAAFVVVPIVMGLLADSIPVAALSALGVAIFPRLAWMVAKRRRKLKLVEQLPDGLMMMAGSLKAGAGLNGSLEMVANEIEAPLSQEFSVVLRELRLGLSLDESLRGMAARLRLEEIDLFVSALAIAKEVGGNLSESLERLAVTLRAKAAMEGKIRALTAQGKLQGIIVGLLPILLAAVLYVMDPVTMMPLFTTPYGWMVIAGVAVMLMLGGVFIRKIVSIDV